jgi:hypothetical protein
MVWSDIVKRSYRDSTWSPLKDSLRSYSPLRETPREYFDCLEETDCQDELILLPEQVLEMDSEMVREDLCSILPSFKKQSPHNSLDSSDSGKSLKLAEDSEGFALARASDGCRTFWLCETGTGMPGVMPASMSRSLNINSQENGLELAMEMNPKMTSSMSMAMGSNSSLNKQPRRNYAHRSKC